MSNCSPDIIIIIIIIIIIVNPLTARVVGAPHMILQPISPFFPVLHRPLGPAELQACPFPDVVFPSLPLSALPSSPFHCALQSGQHWNCFKGNNQANIGTVSKATSGRL